MNGKTDSAAVAPAPSFGAELLHCWEQLPNKGFFLSLLAAWLLLFHFVGNCTFGYIDTPSLLRWMYNAYTKGGEDAEEHGLWVPVLVLGLFWWKRKQLLALPNGIWTPALALLVFALGLHLVGYLVQQQRISIVALFLGIYALTGLAWGRAWMRKSFFPICLFVFCVPIMSIATPITFPLRVFVVKIVTGIAPLVGIDVIREGTAIMNAQHTYQYDIVAACSGLRSVIAILCIATIYGFVSFETNWKRMLMIASAIPLAVLGNVLRLMCIIVAAELEGQSAGNFVHENWFFSLLPYVPAMAGLMLLGRSLDKIPAPEALSLKAKTV